MQEDPDRGMFCIDWNDENPIEILGREQDTDYTRIEFILVPCNYIHTMLDYKEDSISPECIADLQ